MSRTLRSLAAVLLALPAVAGAQARQAAPHPHRAGFVTRHGVRLHYLDFGGRGPAVVLLPGWGLSAHVFDEVAPRLARRHRVVAMTPRGFGESDAPADTSGYTIATLAADLRALLDSLTIPRAALVGHSLSGSTIAAFALAEPSRVTRLVFLDAFPDWSAAGGDSIDALNPVAFPAFEGEMTRDRARDWLARHRFGGWSPALEADLRAQPLGPELERRQALAARYIDDRRRNVPRLSALAVPVLQLCARPTMRSEFGWIAAGTADEARARRYFDETLAPFYRRLCAGFAAAVPGAVTRQVAGSHYVFFLEPARTADEIERFLEAR